LNSEKIWKIWKKAKLNSEKIWKIQKKPKLNCEIIWKIWKKGKLKCEMIWKIWKIWKKIFFVYKTISTTTVLNLHTKSYFPYFNIILAHTEL
jgi:hypothetical protein